MNLVKKLYKIAVKDIKLKKFKDEKYIINKLKNSILLNKDLDKINRNKSIDGLIFQIRNMKK